jgi:hypothetical protein
MLTFLARQGTPFDQFIAQRQPASIAITKAIRLSLRPVSRGRNEELTVSK